MSERFQFFKKFLQAPRKIGSLTLSSRYLTEKMFQDVPWQELRTVVELGAGTGVFTKYIAAHKTGQCRVVVIEQDDVMRRQLMRTYPDFLYGKEAASLPEILRYYGLTDADCIISGLPFAVFGEEEREAVLQAVDHSLAAGGLFVAYQYSTQMYRRFHRVFPSVRLSFTLHNLPPAVIYTCRSFHPLTV